MLSSRGSSTPRDQAQVSCIAGRFFTTEPPEKLMELQGLMIILGFPGGSEVKASASNVGDLRSIPGFALWVRKIPWKRKWQPTPGLLPGESHGRRSLVSYSPRDHKESDTTEPLHFHFL